MIGGAGEGRTGVATPVTGATDPVPHGGADPTAQVSAWAIRDDTPDEGQAAGSPRVVLAPDSFKGCLGAVDVARAMAAGVRAAAPHATCELVPMSDGGEGFLASLTTAMGARLERVEVRDHLGRPHTGALGVAGDLAVVEAAQAVGLDLVPAEQRDVMNSTSTGVGDLLRAAMEAGATRILVGLGGSGTSDGGVGMLTSLGAELLDGGGRAVPPTPSGLARLACLDLTRLDPRLGAVTIEIAGDVTNPLLGPDGAAAVFGPQKGASTSEVEQLDAALARLVDVAAVNQSGPGRSGPHGPVDVRDAAQMPGAGAAGGLGFALLSFLGARLVPGVELVARAVGLEETCRGADLVVTGEGRVDTQTVAGKTPAGVAQVAARAGARRVVVLAGQVGDDAERLLAQGVDAVLPIVAGPCPPEEAMDPQVAAANLARTAQMVARLTLPA